MTPDNLRAWRRRLGLSQTEAGRILNRGQQIMSDYERGTRPVPPEIALAALGWERMTERERAAHLSGTAAHASSCARRSAP